MTTIRAGLCEFDESSKVCSALPVQGEIKIAPHEEDIELGFWSFEWRPVEKTAGGVEPISLILIAGETKCVRLDAKSGRVFALVFSSDQKYFFWFQEKNAVALNQFSEKDTAFLDKLDSILAGPEEEQEGQEVKSEGDVEMKD
ncbi:26S proteasome regulatory subunit RPN13 [Nakaseomyces bracarensis]|uniref:26S proteasome regulatory subunit RPN13 n=1 Tax=Nakaseomyces bracarensis TaxID=273131 RepID=A0ABR4NSU0_9SACH